MLPNDFSNHADDVSSSPPTQLSDSCTAPSTIFSNTETVDSSLAAATGLIEQSADTTRIRHAAATARIQHAAATAEAMKAHRNQVGIHLQTCNSRLLQSIGL